MNLSLTVTLIIFALGASLFGFATWRVRQPRDPLNPRMVDYHVVQIVAIVVILLMAAHLVTLFLGHPLRASAP